MESNTQPAPELATVLTRLAEALEDMAGVVPEGLSPTEAARFIGVSPSKLHALDVAGLIPAAVEIGVGRCPRYLRSELAAWLRAGCPSRAQWRIQREAAMRRMG